MLSLRVTKMFKAFDTWATANRLVVQTTRAEDGRISTQTFANPESRDEYIARAKRLGHSAVVL